MRAAIKLEDPVRQFNQTAKQLHPLRSTFIIESVNTLDGMESNLKAPEPIKVDVHTSGRPQQEPKRRLGQFLADQEAYEQKKRDKLAMLQIQKEEELRTHTTFQPQIDKVSQLLGEICKQQAIATYLKRETDTKGIVRETLDNFKSPTLDDKLSLGMPPETNSPRILGKAGDKVTSQGFSIHERLYILGKDRVSQTRLRNCRSVTKESTTFDFKRTLRSEANKSPLCFAKKQSDAGVASQRRGSQNRGQPLSSTATQPIDLNMVSTAGISKMCHTVGSTRRNSTMTLSK